MNDRTTTAPARVPSPSVQTSSGVPAVIEERPQNTALPATRHGASTFTSASKNVAEALSNIMAEIGDAPVEKKGSNTFHHYKYAKMQDILTALVPMMSRHGIIITQSEHDRAMFDEGRAVSVTYEFTIAHKSGDVWPERMYQTGLCNCRTSKGTFDDKAINKCHTGARKYFLLALFQIPTEDETDPDRGDNDSGGGSQQQRQSRVPSAPRRAAPPQQQHPDDEPEQPQQQTRTINRPVVPDERWHLPKADHSVTSWTDAIIAVIKNAPTLQSINQIDTANDVVLGEIHAKVNDVYLTIEAAMNERREELSAIGAAPVSPPPEDKGGAKKPAGARKKAAKPSDEAPAGEIIPDASADPEKFLEWCKAVLDGVTEAESLEATYTEKIEPHRESMFPPDRTELDAMYKAAEKRLGIE